MSNFNKTLLALSLWSWLLFAVGFAIGDKSANQSAEKEIIELSIELKKLEIKKLKKLEIKKEVVKPVAKDNCTENDLYIFCPVNKND